MEDLRTKPLSSSNRVPAATERQVALPSASTLAAKPQRPKTRKRILIVDDSRTMRMVFRRWLNRSEYEVVDAQNGNDALEKLKSADFDLVTLDIDMPVLDGFGLCAKLRQWEQAEDRNHTPVLIVTSHDTLADRERGFEVGATDFLSKPVTESEFLARIDRLLKTEDRLLGLTALVADDSRVARKSVVTSLARYGITAIEVEDGVQAFQVLQARSREIDFLITDYDMPNMDGKELCRRARTALGLPWLPIIVLSALGDRERVLELFAVGATDYVCKPFTSEELAARISVHIEIRRLNRERERQIAELERLHKLKDNFLAIASHDLRSPLHGILGAAELMLVDEKLAPQHREMANVITQSGDKLLQIINDLLDLARIEASRASATFETVELAPLVNQACQSLRQMAEPKLISVRQAHDMTKPISIRTAGNDIFRLLTNLISNAIKFTPSGGDVTVSTAPLPDGNVSIVVADTGIGIAVEKLPLLFDRFSKLSQVGTAGEVSTGLGMAIVKEIVERHLGTITVNSQLGQGTTITVTLPTNP